MFALFQHGKQISKAHSTQDAARIEAYECGAMIDYGADFAGDTSGRTLANGYEIKPIEDAE